MEKRAKGGGSSRSSSSSSSSSRSGSSSSSSSSNGRRSVEAGIGSMGMRQGRGAGAGEKPVETIVESDGGGGGGRYRSRHGSGCDQSVHGGCDGAQMVSVSLGESHKHGHTKSHEVSQIRSIEVAKRVVQWLLVVVVQGGRIVMVLISTYQHSFSTEKQCRRCLCGTPIWDVRTGQQLHYYW